MSGEIPAAAGCDAVSLMALDRQEFLRSNLTSDEEPVGLVAARTFTRPKRLPGLRAKLPSFPHPASGTLMRERSLSRAHPPRSSRFPIRDEFGDRFSATVMGILCDCRVTLREPGLLCRFVAAFT